MTSEIRLTGSAGEYMESATVVSWAVALGDAVKQGDVVVVVETAKAATEIEAERDGVLVAIIASAGAEVGVGSVLGHIDDDGDAVQEAGALEPTVAIAPQESMNSAPTCLSKERISISPLARRLARQAGLDTAAIVGTGPGGRIKSRDIERILAEHSPEPVQVSSTLRQELRPARHNGGGPLPIVFIHGFGANSGAWNSVRAYLDPTMPSFAPDLPGHGRAAAAAIPSLNALLDATLAYLEDSGLTECHLVGHSLGGAVAATIAANSAIRARSLTLIAPAGLGPDIDGRFLEGFLAARSPASLLPWLERLVAAPSRLPQSYAESVLRERSRLGVDAPQRELAARLFPDATQTIQIGNAIASLHVPTRVIWGQADRIIPVSHSRGLPGFVALHLLADIGHMPHVEAPELISRLIVQTARSANLEAGL
ncbi:acetoin dehydrogenase dihydrolipoyllysine-residue acetyltransferase subunit [Bosea sp. 2KB_26]|uniref:acetoin dehydrogenase dihydrolipoyllysine-residue acetyltransferase subunit n=1 Tax=Bosea sp. 2KB_26 TaxID=3237475 RepID=UPI003F939A5E